MSNTWRIILLLLVWLAYSLIGLHFCSNQVCSGCAADAAGPGGVLDSAELTTNFQRYPLDFSFSNPSPNVNIGFDSIRQGLLSQLGENGILTITGLYFDDEVTPEGTESMGLARAQEVMSLLGEEFSGDRMELRSRTITTEPVTEGFFEGVEFGVRIPAPVVDSAGVEEDPGVQLQELTDRVIFRFPYNSSEEEYDPVIEEYLKELAEELKSSGARVKVVGHTDAKGSPDYNVRLGRERALSILRKLVGLGVSQDQVDADSRGESQPVAPNDSETNRHLNRRVEILPILE